MGTLQSAVLGELVSVQQELCENQSDWEIVQLEGQAVWDGLHEKGNEGQGMRSGKRLLQTGVCPGQLPPELDLVTFHWCRKGLCQGEHRATVILAGENGENVEKYFIAYRIAEDFIVLIRKRKQEKPSAELIFVPSFGRKDFTLPHSSLTKSKSLTAFLQCFPLAAVSILLLTRAFSCQLAFILWFWWCSVSVPVLGLQAWTSSRVPIVLSCFELRVTSEL